jgi:phosphatidylglycerol---prolipoprotein diacylglyceryl transferase
MHRILLASPHVGAYPALLLLALLAGWWLARWRAKRTGIEPRHIDNLALLVAVASLFGARLFSWIFYFPPGFSFWTAMTMGGGGMVFYGGLIFGIACVVVYAGVTRVPLWELFDIVSPPVALGLAIGRVGCFMAGCCWGDVCVDPDALHLHQPQVQSQILTVPLLSRPNFPLAVRFPKEAGAFEQHQELGLIDVHAARSLPVHPVQLYEAWLALLLALILNRAFQFRSRAGEIAVQLVIGYSLIRFITEFFRADNQPIYWGMTLSQVISIALAALAFAFIRAAGRSRLAPEPCPTRLP